MSRINPVFYLLSSTLLFWSFCAGLSNYLATPSPHAAAVRGNKQDTQELAPDVDIETLKENLKKDPKNEMLNLELAFSLVKKGFDSGDTQFIMQAVQTFRDVLDINPKNTDALLGLASLCVQSGVYDKAILYYQKYLEQRPDDLQAKTDYAMATFKIGNLEQGDKLITEVLKVDNKFFPAYAVGAIAFAQSGDKEKSNSYYEKAKEFAPSKEVLASLDQFISIGPESPQDKILSYFTNHQIIGPKLADSKWVDENTLELSMKDFPVEQMPPFAKAAFISKAQAEIAKNQVTVKVVLRDIDSGKELLTIN